MIFVLFLTITHSNNTIYPGCELDDMVVMGKIELNLDNKLISKQQKSFIELLRNEYNFNLTELLVCMVETGGTPPKTNNVGGITVYKEGNIHVNCYSTLESGIFAYKKSMRKRRFLTPEEFSKKYNPFHEKTWLRRIKIWRDILVPVV